VENVCLTTLPDHIPTILVAAERSRTAQVAGRIGDGLLGTTPSRELLAAFRAAGGTGKPRYGKMIVCWARHEAEADRLAAQWQPSLVLGTSAQELALPPSVAQTIAHVSAAEVRKTLVCGPDPARHLATIRTFVEAGYDHVYIQQVGADQVGCIRFYQREILPQLQSLDLELRPRHGERYSAVV
jgi:alkanesulfonate monooxygenase SsuD/methylene tetrahydromethanopterin reductase-like flavin-dependent oxidoreductase (luciferase family)